jgi:two-component system, NtrC family, sensor kinase
LLKSIADKRSVTIQVHPGDHPVTAHVDPDQIQQVLSNLILNAVQAMTTPGTVTVRIGSERIKPPSEHGGPQDEYACISVTDEGDGISEENQRRLFEPFFTTKHVTEGTGLGLSISKGIITEHGGWIAVTSRLGQGSCFSVYLPRRSGDVGEDSDR